MITSVPLATSSLSGVYASKLSEANEAGRMFAKRLSALRRARIPCSGRTGELGPHFGPPTDPIIMLDGHLSSPLSYPSVQRPSFYSFRVYRLEVVHR